MHAANHHEVTRVQLSFDCYMVEVKPENLIGDKAYDSNPLDEDLKKDGIEIIAPHRRARPAEDASIYTLHGGGTLTTPVRDMVVHRHTARERAEPR